MTDYDYFELRHFKQILAVALAQHFTEAANTLHLSQPALSQSIRNLEEHYDIQIFRRDREGYAGLTEVGKIVVAAAEEMLLQRMDLVDILEAFRHGSPSALKLGFTSLVDKKMLTEVLMLARSVSTACEVATEADMIQRLEDRVREGDMDAALVTLPLNDSSDLTTYLLERDLLVVCMRADDPLAQYTAVPGHLLNGKLGVFVYPEVHPSAHHKLLQMLSSLGIKPKDCRPTQNREHVQLLVHERACYALVRNGTPLMPGLTTRPIHSADWTIDTALICRPKLQHPSLALLVRELRKKAWHLGESYFPKRSIFEQVSTPVSQNSKPSSQKKPNRHIDGSSFPLFANS
jgi:DNA-binding transcriptional LysR family regulator